MSLTILLTLGRLPKCLDLARAFAGAGCRVLVADPHVRHLAGRSNSVADSFVVPSPVADKAGYFAALIAIIKREKVDWIVPVSEECLYVSQLQATDIAPARLWGMPFQVIEALHDKFGFNDWCRAQQIPAPATLFLHDEGAPLLAAEADHVIKPRYSCSGKGVALARKGTTLPGPLPEGEWLLQSRLPGAHRSSFSIVAEGRSLITVCYQPLQLSGTVAISFERVPVPPEIADCVTAVAASTGYTGFLSFDFIDDENGVPNVIECNPRATSGIHFVKPAALAAAIIKPDDLEALLEEDEGQTEHILRPERCLQQFYPCLTETQSAMLRLDSFMPDLRRLFSTPDVTFAWRDPLPFVLMPYCAWPIMSAALFGGESFGEAATKDIEWFPDEVLRV